MAEVSSDVLDRLAALHHLSSTRVQEAAIASAVAAWLSLSSVSDEEAWARALWPTVYGAATAMSYEARLYLQTQLDYTGIAPRLPNPNLGFVRADFDGWVKAPLARVTERLAEDPDLSYERAVREAVPMVRRLTDTALRNVEIETVDQLVRSPEFDVSVTFRGERPDQFFRPLTGNEARQLAAELNGVERTNTFKRITQAGACGWCIVVASRLYSYEASLRDPGWHHACRCTWRELTPEEQATWSNPLAGQDWRQVITQRATVPETGDST